MKPVYNSIALQPGSHNGGIASIKIAPKEWISSIPAIDFSTGKVITAISFFSGYDWLTLECAPGSYDYDEKPKSNKSGTYYEVSAAGIINYNDADLQQVLETIRYSELVCLLTDRNKNKKIVGTKDFGMILQLASTTTNKGNGQQLINISLYFETEDAPPFYGV